MGLAEMTPDRWRVWELRIRFVLVAAAAGMVAVASTQTGGATLRRAAANVERMDALHREVRAARLDLLAAKVNLSALGAADLDLDFIPFTDAEMERVRIPPLSDARRSIPPVPDAPTGMKAVALARSFGWPDAWNARQRPTLFLLGPPKSGTTFLAGCWRYAMIGDPARRSYPVARERWPLKFSRAGEIDWGTSVWGGFSLPVDQTWNRTGYRRWDPPKEWAIYGTLGARWEGPQGFIQRQRFPPVEEGSGGWVLMDATPMYIMSPTAADGIRRDFAEAARSARLAPRFAFMLRDPVSRAFSHLLLYASQREERGMRPFDGDERVLATHLAAELSYLRSVPVCRMMLDAPEELLQDIVLVRSALTRCMHRAAGDREPNFLAIGFTALGLRYWLDVFPGAEFRAVRTRDLRHLDPKGMMAMLESVFGVERMRPRCKRPGQRTTRECTAQAQYDHAMLFCSKSSPARQVQAWTGRAAELNYTKGHPNDLMPFRRIAARWETLVHVVMDQAGVPIYRPPRDPARLA